MLFCGKNIIRWINAPASRVRKFDFQFLTYVSSCACCIKQVGLISMRFTGIDQLHIPDASTKIYTNWMSASSWFLCLKNGHYFCMDRLAHKRTQWPTPFREWFCNSEANRHEICTRLRQRVRIKIGRISPGCVKFHSIKLTMMFKLNF